MTYAGLNIRQARELTALYSAAICDAADAIPHPRTRRYAARVAAVRVN